MRLVITLPIIAGLALAACGDSGNADTDGDGTITQEEAMAEAASGGDMAMEPGQWSQTVTFTEVSMPGAPAEVVDMIQAQMGEGITTSQCLTQEDVSRPDASFFGSEGQENCSYDEFDRSGNTMNIRMTCSSPDGSTSTVGMNGSFGADSYTMDINSVVSGTPMGDMTMNGTITGTRTGDC